LLRNGAVVEGVPLVAMEELMDRAHELLNNLSAISGTLNDSLKGPNGTIYQSLQSIDASSASLSVILGKVEKGDGTVGKLLMEDGLYKEMDAFVKDLRAHPWKLLKKDSSSKRKWYFLFLA
jgi:phospholipid/cholesterol/gamma-HCH transport system substrate-binding protein